VLGCSGAKEPRFYLYLNKNHFDNKPASYLFQWKDLNIFEKKLANCFILAKFLFDCKASLDAIPSDVNMLIGK